MTVTLVTGATGFLGGALTRRLLSQGESVVAVGRNRAALQTLSRLGARVVEADLAGPDVSLDGAEFSAVIHCAALSSPWGPHEAFHRANVEGTRNVLRLAREGKAARFVHVSTPSVYFRFEDQDGVSEDAPLPSPVNHYAQTKREAEVDVLAASDLDPVILRPRGLYGAGDTALLPRLMRAASTRSLPLLRDGVAATDLTHIDDVVDAALMARDASVRDARIFNISGGEALPLTEIIERAGEASGISVRWRKLPFRVVLQYARVMESLYARLPGRPEPAITSYGAGVLAFRQTLDISRARELLGWVPKVSFNEGLRRTFRRAG